MEDIAISSDANALAHKAAECFCTMPAITVAREVIENDTPQSLENWKPFEASVQQALAELNALLVAAR
jgi:hypothetical protein